MALKGATPDHSGEERPDRWAVTPELAETGAQHGGSIPGETRILAPGRPVTWVQAHRSGKDR